MYFLIVLIKPIILNCNIGTFKQFGLIVPQQTHHFVSFNYPKKLHFLIVLFSTSSWLLKSLVLVFSACKVVMEIKKTVNL